VVTTGGLTLTEGLVQDVSSAAGENVDEEDVEDGQAEDGVVEG